MMVYQLETVELSVMFLLVSIFSHAIFWGGALFVSLCTSTAEGWIGMNVDIHDPQRMSPT